MSQRLPWPYFSSKIAHYQELKGEKMNENDQIGDFRWPKTIRTEILREILHRNFEGCFRIGLALIPGCINGVLF